MSLFNLFGQKKGDAAKSEFRFTDAPDTACFVCNHVLDKERPILYVTHDADADWQFLCGQDDHTEASARIISLKQVTERDPTVNDLYEMPVGFGAERKTIKDKWQPFRIQD